MGPAGPERRQNAMIVYSRVPVVVLVCAFHGALPGANKFNGVRSRVISKVDLVVLLMP